MAWSRGVEGTPFPKFFWRNAVPLNGANPGTHKGFKGLVGGGAKMWATAPPGE